MKDHPSSVAGNWSKEAETSPQGKILQFVPGTREDPVEALHARRKAAMLNLVKIVTEMIKDDTLDQLIIIGRNQDGMVPMMHSKPADEIEIIGLLQSAVLSVYGSTKRTERV